MEACAGGFEPAHLQASQRNDDVLDTALLPLVGR